MFTILRKATAAVLGLMAVAYGGYKLLMLLAFRGWLLPDSTCQNLIAFANGIPDWQRVLLFMLLALLPPVYLYLLWVSRRADRLIKIAPGTFIQESAVSGFLRGAVGDLEEIKSISARCKMLGDKGLQINCHVALESQRQLDDIQSRLRAAVRGCMAERLAIVPVAEILMTIRRLEADRGARDAATGGGRIMPPAEAPISEPSRAPLRQTIDLSPSDVDESSPAMEPMPGPISLDLPLGGTPPTPDESDEERREGPTLP